MKTTTQALALLAILTMGCEPVSATPEPQPAGGTAVFADASDADLLGAVYAASGIGAAFATMLQYTVTLMAGDEDICLAFSDTDDGLLRVDAGDGCTLEDGTTFEGAAEMTIPDLSSPGATTLRFEAFRSVTPDGFDIGLDGVVESGAMTGPYRFDQDLAIMMDLDGVVLTGEAVLGGECTPEQDQSSTCTLEGEGVLPGGGTYTVPALALNYSRGPGVLELRGMDTLRVDLMSEGDDDCARLTIDGESRDLCGP